MIPAVSYTTTLLCIRGPGQQRQEIKLHSLSVNSVLTCGRLDSHPPFNEHAEKAFVEQIVAYADIKAEDMKKKRMRRKRRRMRRWGNKCRNIMKKNKTDMKGE